MSYITGIINRINFKYLMQVLPLEGQGDPYFSKTKRRQVNRCPHGNGMGGEVFGGDRGEDTRVERG